MMLHLLLAFLLLASAASALPDRSSYLVKGLEEVEPAYAKFDGEMYAGLVPFQNGDRSGEFMFWLFLPSSPSVDDSLVLWLNGGPGCSSLHGGVMFENSPVTIPLHEAGYCCASPNAALEYNDDAWTNVANMLYLEQPGGVGFSNGPDPANEDELSADFVSWLQNFYKVFEDLHPKQLSIIGESYAGMYVPSMARAIVMENSVSSQNKINLFGVGLGNGWMDVKTQGPAVIDYAWNHGMIDTFDRDTLHEEWRRCTGNAGEQGVTPPLHDFTVPDECGLAGAVLTAAGKGLLHKQAPNTYDVTTFDTYEVLNTAIMTTISRFYNNETVVQKLNAPPDIDWEGCIPGEGRRRRLQEVEPKLLDNDRPLSTAPYLVELMQAGVRVLVYNGDRDLSVNSAGTELVLNKIMPPEWLQAKRGLWTTTPGDEMSGWAKEYENLAFLVVYNSGHLVPFNQPKRSLDMLERFLTKATFIDAEIPRFVSAPLDSTFEKSSRKRTVPIGLVVIVAFLAGILACFFVSKQTRRRDYSTVQATSY